MSNAIMDTVKEIVLVFVKRACTLDQFCITNNRSQRANGDRVKSYGTTRSSYDPFPLNR